MHWFLRALEEFKLFRRCVIMSQIAVTVYMVDLSAAYIMYATGLGVRGTDIVMVVGAFHAPQGLVLGYLFKVYSRLKEQDVKSNNT